MQIENNINRLFERYKKSQNLLDTINMNSAAVSPALSTLHQVEMSPNSFLSKPKQRQLMTKMFDEYKQPQNYVRDSSSRERKKQRRLYGNQTEQISRLKETMWLKENMDKDRAERIGIVNRELKIQLRDALERAKDLERKVSQKDAIIRQFEDDQKTNQDNFLKMTIQVRELKIKEEQSNRIVEDIKENYQLLKNKMNKKKSKIKSMKDTYKTQEDQFDQQSQQFSLELERVQKLCEDFSIEIKEQEQRNTLLEQEVIRTKEALDRKDHQIHELENALQDQRSREQDILMNLEKESSKAIEVQHQLDQTELRFDQVKNELKQAYQYKDTEQSRFEDEMRRLTLYYDNDVDKKKTKIAEMKSQLQEKEFQLQQHEKEIEKYKKDTQMQEIEIRQNIDLKKNLEQHVAQLTEAKYQMTDHYNVLREKYERLQDYNAELERQLQIEKYSSNDVLLINYVKTMNDIEKRIDVLLSQLNTVQAENAQLRTKEQEAKRTLKQEEEQREKYKGKYQKSKSQVDLLTAQMKMLEDRLRNYDNEKQNYQREVLKVRQAQSQQETQVKTKLRVLDDIQSMINSHKQQIHN